jgi:hypothetical protein
MQFNPNINPNAPTRTGEPSNPIKGIRSSLIFGRSIPGSDRTVTDYDVRAFLDTYVVPRFPQGFTYTESRGCWKGGQEESFSVSVVYVDHDKARKDVGVKLEEIRAEYIRLFGQDSVLRLDTPTWFSFA